MIDVVFDVYEQADELTRKAVCRYPQYDYDLGRLEGDVQNLLSAIHRRADVRVSVKIEKTADWFYTVTLTSRETPPNTGSVNRVINTICNLTQEYLYKEHPEWTLLQERLQTSSTSSSS